MSSLAVRRVEAYLERALHRHLLVYVFLDPTLLNAEAETRIAILASGRPLQDVGRDLLRALGWSSHPATDREPGSGEL